MAKVVENFDGKGTPAFECVICEEWFKGLGHNPAPVAEDPEARCCGECNATLVIPVRLHLATTGKTYAELVGEVVVEAGRAT